MLRYLSQAAMDNEPKATILDRLASQYGIRVLNPGRWARIDLQHVLEAVEDLTTVMGGSTRFQSEIRRVGISRLPRETRYAAVALPAIGVVYFETAGCGSASELKWQTVHELAHVWDMRRLFRLSNGLKRATRSKYGRFTPQLPIPFEYEPGGRWLKGRTVPLNALEDWADSVATYVYESYAGQRHRMISPVRWKYVGKHVQARLPYPGQWIPHFYGPEGLGPAPI